MKKNYTNSSLNNDYHTGVSIDKISNITDVLYEDYVIDLKTESGSFLLGAIRTHNSFHTGGTLSSNKHEADDSFHKGFKGIRQLLALPKIVKDKATLAEISGTISSVLPAPQGGWFIVIGSHEHYVPGTLRVLVKTGQVVKKGDRLSSGVIKPQELSDLRSPLEAKEHMVSELDHAYKTEGRIVRKPLFETVVASLLNKGQIVDPGSSSYAPGDHANINKLDALNKEGKKIKYSPVFAGLGQAPLHDEDFLARLNFQRLKDTITEGAAQGWESNIHGNNPIPGLVHGAEFGKAGLQ